MSLGKPNKNGTDPAEGAISQASPLQSALAGSALGMVGYGALKPFLGEDPTKQFSEDLAARRKDALMGRLGPSREELEQRKDSAFRAGINLASQGGEEAERAVMASGTSSGVPAPGLSETAANIQSQYIEAAGEGAAKAAADVEKTAATERLVQYQQLQDDEKYLAGLRAQDDALASNLLLKGGRLLFGLSGLGNPLDVVAPEGGKLSE
tara:strand:- start:13447 stop:14073 length:627 start_codon:yes stop_codon:yes gene_type:complete